MENLHLNRLHKIQVTEKCQNLRHLWERSKYSRRLKPEISMATRDRNLCDFSLIKYIASGKVT